MKEPILKKATKKLLTDSKLAGLKNELDAWRAEHTWVEDSALFHCLANFDEDTKDTAWWTWPSDLRCVLSLLNGRPFVDVAAAFG